MSQCLEEESLEASWVPALYLLLGLGTLPWEPELCIQVPSPPLGFLKWSKRGLHGDELESRREETRLRACLHSLTHSRAFWVTSLGLNGGHPGA